jgi:hypothetical protein
MGPTGCPETSVRDCHYSLRNNRKERSSQMLRGGSLKSLIHLFSIVLSFYLMTHWSVLLLKYKLDLVSVLYRLVSLWGLNAPRMVSTAWLNQGGPLWSCWLVCLIERTRGGDEVLMWSTCCCRKEQSRRSRMETSLTELEVCCKT